MLQQKKLIENSSDSSDDDDEDNDEDEDEDDTTNINPQMRSIAQNIPSKINTKI